MPSMNGAERREKVKDLIERYGIWGIPKQAICTEWGIGRPTLDKDIKLIMTHMPQDDINVVAQELQNGYKSAIGEMRKIIRDPESSKTEKSKATQALVQCNTHYTECLEKWNLKPTIASKVEVQLDGEIAFKEALRRTQEAFKAREAKK